MVKFSLLSLLILAFVPAFSQLLPKDVKPKAFILTDISNEPDDAESLVRALLYANEIDFKGIVATTSYWLNDTVHDEDIFPILDAYEKVHPNLLNHSSDYPDADYFRSIVSTGHPVYGTLAFDFPKISKGAANLIKTVDAVPEEDIIWILVWGGASVLAESLKEISKRSDTEVIKFVDKLRVYSISDQDDAGAWIRHEFPKLFYITSMHGWNQYGLSTWVGVAGEVYNRFDRGGPNFDVVSMDWVKENVQKAGGALGAAYPSFWFIMEGDTPSLLHIIPNGLNDPTTPKHGGWGGRYDLMDYSGRFNYYAGVTDDVIGKDGLSHTSAQAGIWRWRDDFQNDFAGRIQWAVKSFEEANHAPYVVVNGTESVKPLELNVKAGEDVYLDSSASYDLDSGKNGEISFNWFHYKDPSATQSNTEKEVPAIELHTKGDGKVRFTVPEKACFNPWGRFLGDGNCNSYHIILEVTDAGSPPLKSYRRIILRTHPAKDDLQHDEL